MTSAELRDHVRQLLDQLGDTADEVADRLRALDIKGAQGSNVGCPLANYLSYADLPAVHTVSVDLQDVCLFTEPGQPNVDVDLPQACIAFVERFDTTNIYIDLLCDDAQVPEYLATAARLGHAAAWINRVNQAYGTTHTPQHSAEPKEGPR